MTEPRGDDESVERGAAEEAAGAPLTETEREVSERPPSDDPARSRPDGDDRPNHGGTS